MRRIRPARERGLVRDGGGARRCAFSSGDFHDSGWTGWGVLRVLNELRLEPGAGPPHPRANMEELGYVIAGTLAPGGGDAGAPALGIGGMYSCGAGHGADADAAGWVAGPGGATVLQAWIQPDRVNTAPARAWRAAPDGGPVGWCCLASPDGAAGSLAIRQQAWLRSVRLPPGGDDALMLRAARRYWLQVVDGALVVDGASLAAGDGLAIDGEGGTLALAAGGPGAALLAFDLPS